MANKSYRIEANALQSNLHIRQLGWRLAEKSDKRIKVSCKKAKPARLQ